MGRVIYSMSVSLDGFVDTPSHSLEWVHVDEELHGAFNAEAREMSAFLYGRRMYELMTAYWPTAEDDPRATPAMVEFGRIWKDRPKLVASRSLDQVSWNSGLLGDEFLDEVARLRAQPGYEMSVGGPTTAAGLWRRGLIDECRLYVHPVIIGAGTPFFPPLEQPTQLRLLGTRTFSSGVVHLRYSVGR